MAVLQETQNNNSRIVSDKQVPKGSYIAVCIDVEDNFGVQRPKFDDPTQFEIIDTTTFYFGLKKGSELFVIRSKPFKLSLHEKSALFQFLKQWNNEPPKAGFDTLAMINQGAQLTVEHNMSNKGRIYANISSIAPIMEGLEKMTPVPKEFVGLLQPKVKKAPAPEPEADEADEIPF